MKKQPNLSSGYANGLGDGRNESTGSMVPGLGRKLPPLSTQQGDGRGRAPTQRDMSETGISTEWPKANDKIHSRG